jgi:hypothetical protein
MTPKPFTDVAMLLVNGNDPKRLAIALASYARLIGVRRLTKDDDKDDRDMLTAARILEEKLPYYDQDYLGLRTPDYIHAVLIALPELIEFLEAQVRHPREGGRLPDSRRRICAAVCAEAWRHYHHGQVQPFSSKLQEACEVYWQSCGHPETGEANGSIRNWERFLRWAVDESDEEFREDFLHYITTPK